MAERDIIANLVVKGGEAFVQTVTQSAKAEEQLNKELNANTAAVKQNEVAQEKLTTKLRRMQDDLSRLALAGKANTEEYRKLRDEAGALADAIGDASAEIRQAGSDTRGLDKALRAATVLTGAFTAVQGAAALFGKDSENLQKSLLKVQAALSVLNGLQAIQTELLRKDSIFTTALTRAKAAYSAAVAAATGATRGFTAALVATGIGAAVVAIGLLVANWDKLVGAIRRATGAQEENTEAQKRAAAERERQKLIINSEIQLELKRADLLEAEGKKSEARIIRQAALQRNLNEAKQDESTLADQLTKKEEQFQKALQTSAFNTRRLAEAQNERAAAQGRTGISEAAITERILKNANAIRAEYEPAIDDLRVKLNEQAQATAGAKIALINLDEKQKESTSTTDKAAKSTENLTKKTQDLQKVFASFSTAQVINADSTVISILTSQIGELNKQIENLESGDPLGAVLIGNVIELEEKLKLVKAELEAIRIIATGGDLQSIDVKINTDEAVDSITAARNALNDLFNQPRFGRDALGPSQEEIEKERDRRIKIAQEIADASFQIFAQSQAAQQQVLDNKLRQGLITEEEYNEKVAELRRKEAIAAKAQAIFEASINLGVAITAALKKGLSVAAFTAALAAAQLAAIIATPIPRFFKGVKNFMGGLAWVGDGGKHEVVRTPSGQVSLTPDKPTLTYLPKGTDVFKDVPTFQREAGIHNMRTPSLRSLPPSEEARERKEMVKLLKKGNAKYDEVVGLLRQGNKNTRQSVNELRTMNKPKRFHRV